ncbi:MAG: dependent oxidoreductase [Enterovirga sp.]|nr:dependent oxidoreductase [Enterovirga sp.]
MTLHVVVIGAGAVGAAAALALLRDGHRVTILEPEEPGGPQAASYGNGAWISPASVVPVSMPGLWRKVPGYLLDPAGPFTIRPGSLPGLLPWLVRFVRAGATVPRVEATARTLAALLGDAPERHEALAASAGVADLIRRTGLLYPYPERAGFEAEALAWRLRREAGVAWTEHAGDAVRAIAPDLAPHYRFAVHVPAGAHCTDPGAYVGALIRHAKAEGATLVRGRALGFSLSDKHLQAVATDAGEIRCDRAVIAAGIRSGALARKAGDRVPLAAERGYHVVVADPEVTLAIPAMPSDGKMANTSTRAGLRSAGQVELAHPDAPPNWRRADILLAHLKAAYPALPRDIPEQRLARWMGCRPSTPDGVPVIGRASGSPDILHAFGHGHVGLAAGAATGGAIADLVAGRSSHLPMAAFSARRFR